MLVVDIQNDYFPGGAFPLVGPEDAAARAGEVLARFRSAGRPVVHVQHVWDAPDLEHRGRAVAAADVHAATSTCSLPRIRAFRLDPGPSCTSGWPSAARGACAPPRAGVREAHCPGDETTVLAVLGSS